MGSIIDNLFNDSQIDAIQKLWVDKNNRLIIQQEIGKRLIDSKKIINDFPLAQIMFISTLSPFASSEKECYDIANIIHWGIKRIIYFHLMPNKYF